MRTLSIRLILTEDRDGASVTRSYFSRIPAAQLFTKVADGFRMKDVTLRLVPIPHVVLSWLFLCFFSIVDRSYFVLVFLPHI